MNVKKEAFEAVLSVLEKERRSIEYEMWKNKREFKKLTERQTLLKRERAEITRLLRLATGKVNP